MHMKKSIQKVMRHRMSIDMVYAYKSSIKMDQIIKKAKLFDISNN